jgi:hypothetical protein
MSAADDVAVVNEHGANRNSAFRSALLGFGNRLREEVDHAEHFVSARAGKLMVFAAAEV